MSDEKEKQECPKCKGTYRKSGFAAHLKNCKPDETPTARNTTRLWIGFSLVAVMVFYGPLESLAMDARDAAINVSQQTTSLAV